MRACDYYDIFNLPKILWGNLCIKSPFTFDDGSNYINAPACFIPTNDLCLLGIINSSLIWFLLKNIACGRSGDFIEAKPIYINQLPIHQIQAKETHIRDKIINSVKVVLEIKKKLYILHASTKQEMLEREIQITYEKIDDLVYELYGISESERKLIKY